MSRANDFQRELVKAIHGLYRSTIISFPTSYIVILDVPQQRRRQETDSIRYRRLASRQCKTAPADSFLNHFLKVPNEFRPRDAQQLCCLALVLLRMLVNEADVSLDGFA